MTQFGASRETAKSTHASAINQDTSGLAAFRRQERRCQWEVPKMMVCCEPRFIKYWNDKAFKVGAFPSSAKVPP